MAGLLLVSHSAVEADVNTLPHALKIAWPIQEQAPAPLQKQKCPGAETPYPKSKVNSQQSLVIRD